MVQNVFMCLGSIGVNGIFILWNAAIFPASQKTLDLSSLLQVFVSLIVINNAMIGVVTSLFLKHLNSVVKSVASAIEVVLTAILSCLVLGIQIHWNTVTALVLLVIAIAIYVRNPIKISPMNSDIKPISALGEKV